MSTIITMHIAPAALERETAAAYVSLRPTTLEKLVREGRFPAPRQLSDNRVAWLRQELDAWLIACPRSDIAPPENTGVLKPRPSASKRSTPTKLGLPNAQQAA